jgi:hypothetical protein
LEYGGTQNGIRIEGIALGKKEVSLWRSVAGLVFHFITTGGYCLRLGFQPCLLVIPRIVIAWGFAFYLLSRLSSQALFTQGRLYSE